MCSSHRAAKVLAPGPFLTEGLQLTGLVNSTFDSSLQVDSEQRPVARPLLPRHL